MFVSIFYKKYNRNRAEVALYVNNCLMSDNLIVPFKNIAQVKVKLYISQY